MVTRAGCVAMGLAGVVLAAPHPPQVPAVLVTVPVIITTAKHDVVTDLTREEFVVEADSRPHTVASFSLDEAPVALALVLDRSESMRVDVRDKLDGPFVDNLTPADRVRVVSFGERVFVSDLVPGTRRDVRGAVEQAFKPMGKDPSPIWDAVDAGVTALSSESLRRAIVLVTDGRATANVHSLAEVAQHAVAERVPVTVIDEGVQTLIRQTGTTAARVHPETTLKWLAQTTGGVYMSNSPELGAPRGQQGRDEESLLVRAVKASHHTYLIGLSVTPDGKLHNLSVTVTRPGVTVSAQTVFLAR